MKVILSNIYPYLFLFFCFVIPLDKYATAVPNIVLITLLISFPFVVQKNDFKKLLKKEVLLFFGLIIFLAFNMIVFQDGTRDINIVQKIGSALLLLVLFIPLKTTENLEKTIIISVFVCIGICLFNLYGFYMQEGEFNFAAGAAVNDVLILDRLYIGFLCVLSIILSIGLIGERYNDYNKWYFANIILCIVFVLLISSRVAVILLLVLFFLKIFYSKRRKEFILFFIGVLAIVLVAFAVNKNLGERFFYTQSSESKKSYIELFMAWEPRVIIWECNYKVLEKGNSMLVGNGFYGTKDMLMECYSEIIENEDKRDYFVRERFNPHNQFFDFLISYGIIAATIFIVNFIVMFFKHRRSYYKTSLVLSLAAFAFIESYFHRQLGAYIFAIAFILILYPMFEDIPKNSKINEESKN